MVNEGPTLTDLAQRGESQALEDRWFAAIEHPQEHRADLLEALAVVSRQGRGGQAAALAWTWLATEQERAEPAELLALGRELLLRVGDSDEIRKQVLRLYKEVYGDRPGIDRLIEASGLGGAKSSRRALRTLEICLDLRAGDCLISRSDEHAAEVTAVDPKAWAYTVRSARVERTLDPDELALAYDPAGANDFRILLQLHPERIGEMLETDPVPLIIGILKSHHGRLDSDQLEHLLSPRFIPADGWRKWWTQAKAKLRRCPNVVLEGKARVILTYHAEGQSLEDEILPQWEGARTPDERLAVIDAYFREAKARGSKVDPGMIERMRDDLLSRISVTREGSPAEALVEALVIDRLAEGASLPHGSSAPACDILRDAPDLLGLLRGVKDPHLLERALTHVKEVAPAEWPTIYARLLPFAPLAGCDAVAQALVDAGHRDLLAEAVDRIPSDLIRHLDASCWLWRGPSIENLETMPPRELLLRFLNHLGEVMRSDAASMELRRDTRTKIRAILSSGQYARYREVIVGMEPGLASTVRRTIDRLDGLGQVVRSKLLSIILDTHPELVVGKAKVDPWTDDGVIFSTHEGMQKRKQEMDYLVNVKMPENARAIGEAASRGDLSENSEYRFALEERDLLRSRVATMQRELSVARLLTANDVSTDAADIGTRVTLEAVDGAGRHDITILGPFEADVDKDVYNYRAPLCMKLRNLRVGEVVELNLDGDERQYRVESIANALAPGPAGRAP